MGESRDFSFRTMRLASLVILAGAVAACEEGIGSGVAGAAKPEAEAALSESPRTTGRDIEAPEAFSTSEAALWDGRPSLGGVWVAHPDVTDPERVIIRNTANGKSVTGALFRREREVPGPRLQASSDAATALGMLAGAPVNLNVVALRREEVKPEPAPETQSPVTEVASVSADDKAKSKPLVSADGDTETASGDARAVAESTADPAAKDPFFKRLFGRKPTEEADVEQTETTTAATSAGVSPVETTEITQVAATAPRVRPKTVTPADGVAVTEAATDAVAEGEVSKPDEPLFKRLFSRKREEAVGAPLSALAEPAPAASIAAATKPKASRLNRPYVQVGTFSEAANAERAADKLRKAGVIPTVSQITTNGKPAWRVIAGPVDTVIERDALLKSLRDTGFNDAYAVTN